MNKEEIEQMIEDCMNRQSLMSDWEIEFMQSLDEQFTEKGSLTDKQIERLNKVWDKVTG